MIRVKEKSRKDKDIKEDVPVGTPVCLALSFWIERNGRNHRLAPCVLVAPLGEAVAPDHKGRKMQPNC